MDGWNTSFLLGWPIFRGYVSFREGKGRVGGVSEDTEVLPHQLWNLS